LGVTAALLEVVLHPVKPGVPRLLVLGQPVMERPELRRFQAVQPTAAVYPAPDESRLAEHPQVLRHLRLGHREVVHDRSDRLLAGDQRVQDFAPVRRGDGVEDI
jgi:hypothetical protein